MKIAVLSDVHDNYFSLVEALKIIKEKKCEQILFLWDLWHGRMAKIFVNFEIPTLMIWGNNDGEKNGMMKFSLTENSNLEIVDNTYKFCEFAWKKIFISHYPEMAGCAVKSGSVSAVFFWHTHKVSNEKENDCLVCNPGEISWFSHGKSTFAIYDTIENYIEILEVDNFVDQVWTFDEIYEKILS